jgi:glycosyltransferase involved in cell wall biosynthesis
LSGTAKWNAYREADLFVLPSHSENFGMAAAEALATGTPAIVTKGAPWAGLTQQGAGWWPDVNVDSLAECLDTALRQPASELEAMGLRGREWMKEEFSWARIASMMQQTYRWVLQGGAAPAWVRLT